MRTTKNETPSAPKITIEANGKDYRVFLTPIEEFIEETSQFMNIEELIIELESIEIAVIDATEDRVRFEEVKRSLKLLRQLKYLFNGLYREQE
jgi:hypothetical protein